MSVRADIVANLATELATITTANGYASDVHRVNLDVRPAGDSLTPAGKWDVDIVDDGEGQTTLHGGSSQSLKEHLYTIRGDADAASYGTTPMARGQKFLSDVEKLIEKPISLGANVRFVEATGDAGVSVSKSKTIVHVQVLVTYFITKTSP